MIRRFAVGTALVTGLTLSLTGCLGDAGDKVSQAGENIKLSAAQALGKSAEKTGQLDSFQADIDMNMSAPDGNVKMAGTMQYQLKPQLAYSMNYSEMSVGGQSMGGMQQILVDRTMYMKMPMLSEMAGGKPWMKISLDEIGKQAGLNIDQLMQQSQQMDPVQNMEKLTASKDVREVGKENVNGVETTHYAGTYQMADAVAELPAEQQEAARKSIAESGIESMKFDVWVDGQQLPQKMTMSTPSSAAGAMTMSMTYRDYGKPVQIAAPPASQVTDMAQMMQGMGGGLGGS
ncbi:putative lipoprotein [Actinomadura cremea]|nr:putative lipoprotein [Actinomadura cremea]